MMKAPTITIGIILALLGLLGFISNSLIGENAFFVTNGASNWLHLIAGIVIFIAGMYWKDGSGVIA